MIRRLHSGPGGYAVSELCEAFDASRSGYYRHLRKPEGKRHREDEELPPKIVRAFAEGRENYGTPRLRKALLRRGVRVSREHIARIMKEDGPRVNQKPSFIPRTTVAAPPRRLLHHPPVTRPDQAWVGDITYVRTGEGWLFLAAVMDLHTRRVPGWAADHMRAELVEEALNRARHTRSGCDPTGAIAHSDRGSQYTSAAFRRDLEPPQMAQSMSRKANCYDNAAMKSFWASLKREAFRSEPATRAEARFLIHDYIDAFYNTRRLHSSLDYMSPLDFEHSLLQTLN